MVDAIVGPPVTLPYLALSFARDELGQEEVPRGSNWGGHIPEYLSAVGIHQPAEWCAAFGCWCALKAAAALGRPLELRLSPGALRLLELNAALRIATPEVGALAVWDHGGGKGHVGLIEEITAADMGTIEGNTDEHGGRLGYMVARRRRLLDDPRLAGFIRLASPGAAVGERSLA